MEGPVFERAYIRNGLSKNEYGGLIHGGGGGGYTRVGLVQRFTVLLGIIILNCYIVGQLQMT